jgi:uncharacterized protein (DUF2236 family)
LVLGSLDLAAASPFGPGSAIRRVVGEPVMTLLYPRALAMQVAHASVAAAVAEHSQFQQRPIYRLWATSDAALRLVFGAGPEPMAAARQIYRFHDGIHGVGEAGPYTAHDASLLLWVWATLVDTCDMGFTRWVRPYRPGEGDRFYQDMCAFARFFGIPPSLIPSDRAAFAEYMGGVLAGDELGRTAASIRLVRDILWFRKWFFPPGAVAPLRVLAVGTLDPRLACRLGLSLDAYEMRLFEVLDGLLRLGYARLPPQRTNIPYGYLTLRRLAERFGPAPHPEASRGIR